MPTALRLDAVRIIIPSVAPAMENLDRYPREQVRNVYTLGNQSTLTTHSQRRFQVQHPKLCSDCRWHQPSPSTDSKTNLDRCLRPGAVWGTVDVVRGNHQPAYAFNERNFISTPGNCGLEAKFWEPHPSTFLSSEEAEHGNPSF